MALCLPLATRLACIAALSIAAVAMTDEAQPARRICRLGPKRDTSGANYSVLIIGDSISIGVMGRLKKLLCPKPGSDCLASVDHAPTARGGGSVDSKYAMNVDVEMTGAGTGPPWLGNLSKAQRFGDGCLNGTMLVTEAQEPVQYDVISFNYGVHDVYYGPGMGKGENLVEEWVPPELYRSNLRAIKRTLQATGAKVIFQSSTPICYNVTTNQRIMDYNAAAKAIMAEPPAAAFNDLYKVVTDVCGQPPYNAIHYPGSPNCSIANYNNVHYQSGGWDLLAQAEASAIQALLTAIGHQYEVPVAPARALLGKDSAPVQCSASTSCPAGSSCMKAAWSYAGIGCCIGYGTSAVQCADSFHCCPEGWSCSGDCALGSCSCLPPAVI